MPIKLVSGRSVLRLTVLLVALLWVAPIAGQLPPDAVDLAQVKIPEAVKSTDFCPVKFVPSAADGESWTHAGVEYRGSEAGVKTAFASDPDGYAAKAAEERYVDNFMLAMSTIWCPITDEVTPGGRKQVDGLGFTWESCCSFCDEEMTPDNFDEALENLERRAVESFELITQDLEFEDLVSGGIYTEGASSPVEGAIRDDI